MVWLQADAAWTRAQAHEGALQAALQRMALVEAEAALLRSRLAAGGAAAATADGRGGAPHKVAAVEAAPMEPEAAPGGRLGGTLHEPVAVEAAPAQWEAPPQVR